MSDESVTEKTEAPYVDPLAPKPEPESDIKTVEKEPDPEPENSATSATSDTESSNVADDDDYTYGEEPDEPQKPRLYTEEEVLERMNEAVRERVARFERNATQQEQNEARKAADDFEYNPNGEGNWEQQLEAFIEKAIGKISQKKAREQYEAAEMERMQAFESKFAAGMKNYPDFKDVVGQHRISDEMTLASRHFKDPAKFWYQAAKQAPDELKRIAAIDDRLAQAVEIGQLEIKMRKKPTTTKAPRPADKVKDESGPSHKDDRSMSVDDLIRRSDKRRLERLSSRRR